MKKPIKRVLALVAATVVLSASVVSASAAETVKGSSTSFNKYLVFKEQANVPKVTFNFTISSVAQKEGREDDVLVEETRNDEGVILTPRVYATNELDGVPKITSSVSFKPGDATYSTVQEGDTLTLKEGYKYAKMPLTLDFGGVTFTKPGIYRFKLTETDTELDGITNDEDLNRYCDVYVNQNPEVKAQDLKVQGYCIHKSSDKIPTKDIEKWNDYGAAIEAGELKDNGFENIYTTYDLTIQKNITGNHGWKNNYFRFTLELKSVLPNTRYDLDLSKTTSAKNTEGLKSRVEDGKTIYFLETNDEGSATYTFYLSNKGGIKESIKVFGLTAATTYKISEDYQDYDPSWIVNYNDAGVTTKRTSADKSGAISTALAMTEHDNEAVFTNNRVVNVATGVAMDLVPLAVVVLLGTAAAFTLVARKKRNKVTE